MSTYDKSEKVGYDDTDNELNEALSLLHAQHPKVARRVQQRVHEGILQRMKEEGTRKCYNLLIDLERCMNGQGWMPDLGTTVCAPQRDAINECFRGVHTEENYQRYRLKMLRGELLQEHASKTLRKIEAAKTQSPETISQWKPDYAWRYKMLADRLGTNTTEDQDDFTFHGFGGGEGGGGNNEGGENQQQQQQQQQQKKFNPMDQEQYRRSVSSTTNTGDQAVFTPDGHFVPSTYSSGGAGKFREFKGAESLEVLAKQREATQEFRKSKQRYGMFTPAPPEFNEETEMAARQQNQEHWQHQQQEQEEAARKQQENDK